VRHSPPSPFLLIAIVSLAAPGCGSEDGGSDSDSGAEAGESGEDESGEDAPAADGGEALAVSYWRDAKPILDAKCNGCHYEGGVAPFSMETFADAVLYAPASRAAIEAGTMPPWHAKEGCRDYLADRSLDDDQRATLLEWIDAGTPEGDPELVGEPLPSDVRTLPRVDTTLTMPSEYTPQTMPDDHRCFIVDWPAEYTTPKFVTGTQVKPGNLGVVHHVLVFHAQADVLDDLEALDEADPGPGYECFAGAGVPVSMLGGWAPGGGAATYDDGMGVRVEPGGKVVIQMHYNTLSTGPAPDRSGIDLMLADEVDREMTLALTTDPRFVFPGGMPIEAGEQSVIHESVVPRGMIGGERSVELFAIGMHMHMLGRRGWAEIEREDGSRECLLEVDDWDFNWQGSYGLAEPTILRPGDALRFGCEFDNSADNQPFIDGQTIEPQYTEWGDGTTDEMCLLPVLYSPVD